MTVAHPASAFRMPRPEADGAAFAIADSNHANRPVLVAIQLFPPHHTSYA
jgi:hypothetical protein